ncbi:phosphate acetyltransferase [Patescibacteria group bacterium]
MHKFLRKVQRLAKNNPRTIVFPEGTEERILKATEEVSKKKIANLVLVGPEKTIKENAKNLKLKIKWDNIQIHDPEKSPLTKKYAEIFYELRKHKNISKDDALKAMKDMNYFGTMMVYNDDADGLVTGTTYSTAESIRPALQIIKTKEKFHKVSGIFFMALEKKLLLFADTAITIDPNSHDLVDIAIDTAETAKAFGIEPKIAMLSFSTKGSARHPAVDKVQEAVAMIKSKRPELMVDGEMQVDAALVPKVAAKKCPNSPIQGDANILIFPNLESANIAYKLVERLAKAKAVGPVLQGLKKPVNDLSRGCHYKDIVNITALTVCECNSENPHNKK